MEVSAVTRIASDTQGGGKRSFSRRHRMLLLSAYIYEYICTFVHLLDSDDVI